MSEIPPDTAPNELVYQAFLYASGELDEVQAADFERRLAGDQAARDALCQAVELNLTLTGEAPAVPDPSYRQRVRQRLHQRRRHMRKLASSPGFFGAPALWAAFGAAATLLLMVVMHYLTHFPGDPVPSTVAQTKPEPSPGELERQLRAAEEQADQLISTLARGGSAEERRQWEERLHELARAMVDFDAQLMQFKARRLAKDLAEVNASLKRLLSEKDQLAQKRYEEMLRKVEKRKGES